MTQDSDMFINRIVQGGIYFLRLSFDEKMRPYLVVSKNNGYGMNVLAFMIMSKYTDSQITCPIVLSNTVSFIRASGTIEIQPKSIISADFAGIVQPEILDIVISIYMSRFIDFPSEELEKIRKKSMDYLKLLESKKYGLHDNSSIQFTAKDFLENSLCKNNTARITDDVKPVDRPFKIEDWSINDLRTFKNDMNTMNLKDLTKKYNFTSKRIDFLKKRVNHELNERKKK